MTGFSKGLALAGCCLALSACHLPWSSNKTPSGQVVAVVQGREITLRELQAEMGGATIADPKMRKLAEQVALKDIVIRTVLAKAARDQGLDKTPEFAVQKDRVIDLVLGQQLQKKVTSAIPQPTKEEAQAYVSANLARFADRKIYGIDQIRMARVGDPAFLKQLQPLHTLEAIEALLKQDNIPYQRSTGSFDSLAADPRFMDQITKLPPGEPFVVPSANGFSIIQVKESKVVPLSGDAATDYAEKFLTRQRNQESVSRAMSSLLTKAAPDIHFNKDYAPPTPPPAAKAPATPAPPAA